MYLRATLLATIVMSTWVPHTLQAQIPAPDYANQQPPAFNLLGDRILQVDQDQNADPGEFLDLSSSKSPSDSQFPNSASLEQDSAEDLNPDGRIADEADSVVPTEIAKDFGGKFSYEKSGYGVGIDLYSTPIFGSGITIEGDRLAMKFGGFVKTDFIHDFDPIDSTDSFITPSIPIGARPRNNTRVHARSTRFSFDTRWKSDRETIRAFVEGDFFSQGDRFRLRHAFGEVGQLIAGKTWTAFHQTAASPRTLDIEGSVAAVNRRQAQVRWTQPIWNEDLTLAVSVEDARIIVDAPTALPGEARSPAPDTVLQLRLNRERAQIQVAGIYRLGGFEPDGALVTTGSGWGLNFSGAALIAPRTEAYYQIVFGDGIGSYRGLPDAAPISPNEIGILSTNAWMVGVTHDWSDKLNSNFTYAENRVDNLPFQPANDIHRTTYLAANLVWSPKDRVDVGIEYLYGTLENVAGDMGRANRLQVSVIFFLP